MDSEMYSHLWKLKAAMRHLHRRCHATHCIVCSKEFKRDDLVYDDVAITFHEACLEGYIAQEKELGFA